MSKTRLFILTFGASFWLIAGMFYLAATFWPWIYAQVHKSPVLQGQLPLAENVQAGYFDIVEQRQLARQPYPGLTDTQEGAPGNWIRIPAINVNVPLVMSASMQDEDILATLGDGAALYPNGVMPGRLGNTFISAHSTGEPWKGLYRFAFVRIDELEPGNLIHLDWEGTRYTYRMTREELVKPNPDFRVASDRPVPTLAVMACWPLWTTQQRMLVHGELVNVTQLTRPPV